MRLREVIEAHVAALNCQQLCHMYSKAGLLTVSQLSAVDGLFGVQADFLCACSTWQC